MLKIPKTSKYRKSYKGKLKNIVSKNYELKDTIHYGVVALKSLESGRITPNHINCCKQLLNKNLKKFSQIRFSIFPHIPITKKPLEVRMGKGKGSVDTWVFNIFTGSTLVEIEGNNLPLITKGLNAIRNKLPIRTQIVYEI